MNVQGSALKAYLIREVADGATANAYAPFYLWTDPDALGAFHWEGQGFSGIVSDFGRPPVQTWIGGHSPPRRALQTNAHLRHEDTPGSCTGR